MLIVSIGLYLCSLLIKQLENVDPRKLTHQEKLAFWINVHNALVMHVSGLSLCSFDLLSVFFLL